MATDGSHPQQAWNRAWHYPDAALAPVLFRLRTARAGTHC